MSDYPHRDQLFNEPIDQIADFAFDEKVAAVFPDMIKRSVPGYTTIVSMTGVIAERYATANSIDNNNTPVKLIEADLLDIEITNASVVVLNFTLQFIAKQRRKQLIQRIYQGMNKGAILILSEKIYFEDQQLQKLNTDLHHEFKRLNGYSKLEIAQKRTAIENILIPESIAEHQARLTAAGFSSCDVWFQCFNFASLVAVK